MTHPSRRRSARAGLTLLEAAISATILAGLISLAVGATSTSAQTASAAAAMTDAQTTAERVLRLVREQLAMSASSPTPSIPGLLIVDPNPADQAFEVEFTPINLNAPLFNAADPTALPWASSRRVIKFEKEGAETLDNGVDDDSDYLVDEGRITLYRRTGGADLLIAPLGASIRGFLVTHDPVAAPLPRASVQLTVERTIPGAVRDRDVATGKFPTARHTAHALVTLLN